MRVCPPPEEFNDRILSPELSDGELQRLHAEVLHIYRTYCLDQSVDKISFDKFIVEEIRNSKTTPAPRTLPVSWRRQPRTSCDRLFFSSR